MSVGSFSLLPLDDLHGFSLFIVNFIFKLISVMVRLNVVACGWTGLFVVVSSEKAMVVFTDLFTGSYVQQIRR